jgi:DNA ligase-1
MQFKQLAQFWQKIEGRASRLEMTAILADLFKEAGAEEINKIVYLSLGCLQPKFAGVEFNLAEKMVLRSINRAFNCQSEAIYKKTGDLGKVISNFQLPISNKISNLTVKEVYQRLWEIAVDSGQGSQERKVNNLARLMQDLDSLSAQFIVRIPVNNLRLGFSDMTVLDGLSWMVRGDKSLRPELEKAFNVCADIGFISQEFKNYGIQRIQKIKPQAGVPVRPQKSERLASAEAIVEKLKTFAVEGKWDGLRVQIHLDRASAKASAGEAKLFEDKQAALVRIFSRNLDNITAMFPDISAAVEKLAVKSIILDGEAVAFDPKTGKLRPFQETVQRKRVHGISEAVKSLPIKVFVYDILFLNGGSLIEKPFRQRRKILEAIINQPGVLNLAKQDIVADVRRLRELMADYLKQGLEGVMAKKLDEPYQAGARNFNWVKLKKATEGKLVDTLDCAVMGYYLGKGKRTGFGIGAFLVGVISGGKIGSVAKIGTGLTDEQWREMQQRCQKLSIKVKPAEYLVAKNLNCDVWVKPQLVTEILADEITKSPIHAFGLALRFPRLVNFRDDKTVADATAKQELEKLFRLQKQ